MSEFAWRLKNLREYHGLTQAEVAKSVNLSPAAIGNYERGAREPGIGELIILADFFNVSTDYLLGRTEDYTNINPKMKIIRYAVVETLKVPCSLKEKEIDMIIHILANGRKCFWNEEA